MCVTRCIQCAINVVLPISFMFWAASISTPGWQKLETPNGMQVGVGLFYSVCVGFQNSSELSVSQKAEIAFDNRKDCFDYKERDEREPYENATIGLCSLAGFALLFCMAWSCVTCLACCCTGCLTLPLVLAALSAAAAAAAGVIVFFAQADTPEEFMDAAEDTFENWSAEEWRDKTRIWYSGYLMLASAFFAAICGVFGILKACCSIDGNDK